MHSDLLKGTLSFMLAAKLAALSAMVATLAESRPDNR
jgi:hypothetical protein